MHTALWQLSSQCYVVTHTYLLPFLSAFLTLSYTHQVSAIHKANIMKLGDGMFLKVGGGGVDSC